jgi:adenylosuccinate synthase
MKRAIAVIGAAFGDEGKGLLTDYFCRKAGTTPMVVRFNGGAQAGHTVVTPDGDRHIFHHFGAGTLAGARTFLSRHFLVNPVLWRMEYEELFGPCRGAPQEATRHAKYLRTRIFVDREAPLTTIWDMLENQHLERSAGDARHGSCGVGINATMRRQTLPHLRLFAGDLQRTAFLEERVFKISEWYAHSKGRTYMTSELYYKFLDDCHAMAENINLVDSRELDNWEDIIFEGAQGLLLDQDNKQFFPHVTHSKTGLPNVLQLCQEARIEQLYTCHVMRSYMTRHGAGPLPWEDPSLSYADDTNVENEWQGKLRFAPFDHMLLKEAIWSDLSHAKRGPIDIVPRFAMTHLDQNVPAEITNRSLTFPIGYASHGPTCNDVEECFRR